MKFSKRLLAIFLMLLMVLSVATTSALATENTVTGTDVSTSATTGKTDAKKGGFTKYKYSDYEADHADAAYGTDKIVVPANTFIPEKSTSDVKVDLQYESQDAETFAALEGIKGASVYTGETSTIAWTVNIPKTGKYAINVLYYAFDGKKSDMERSLFIDQADKKEDTKEAPFVEANALVFPRTWKDNPEDLNKKDPEQYFKTDVYNNQLRPNSVEVFGWYDIDCRDSSGNCGDWLYFYLTEGTHTIEFKSQREAMIVNRLTFYVPDELPTYADLKAEYASKGYAKGTDTVKVQAERPSKKSATTLYAEYDRTTPVMEPYHHAQIKLNEIDGGKFTSPYQWLTWEMNVKEAGLYRIVTRFQQSSKDGSFCNRTLYINGKVPCQEAKTIRFNYDSNWQVEAISTQEGEEMYFYLEEGVNEITLEVTLGEFASVLDRVDTVVYNLNQCYREILMITGSTPDTYRDYNFRGMIPETIASMEESSKEIKQIVADIEALVGDSGSFTSSFKTLVQDIDTMTENPRMIAKRLQNFKSNLGTISTWLLNATSQPVSMDWVMVAPVESELPKAKAGFFAGVKHHTMMFLASFYVNYDDIGRMDEAEVTGTDVKEKDEVEVWVTTSLDQSQIVRTLINNELKNSYPDMKVNLRLVAGGTVLPSIAAGTGPDIVLGVGASDPINYAIRGAVTDMSQFENYNEVMKRFNKNAVIPYQYKGKTYGLPETFTFPMLFYRKDVLSELNMEVPQTWDEVYNTIVKLNMNSMMFGIPSAMSTYGTLLYQNGLEFYNADGSKSALDSPQSIQLFQQWTEFFTSYQCLVAYDFANRFRTGETPIGIADYTAYNQLSVFAPEIRGLWGFTNVPGIKQEDGSINHRTLAGGTASIILKTSENPQAAWNFLEWWTSTEIQVAYGLEIESILGTASRYATANLEAARRLPWSTADFKAIEEAWEYATALPEYPGSYIVGRYVNFAFLDVVNNQGDPGEQLMDYVKMINEELTRKQAEFAESAEK